MGKNSIFQNNKVEIFKNLEILWSKRFFQFSSAENVWYIHASKLKFSTYVLYWECYRKIKNQTIKFSHKIEKNENSLILERFTNFTV